ncbi:MAG: NUDIX domain-containing protein [Nanoarchaeota archaeon]
MKLFVATKALIRRPDGKVLLLREADGYVVGTNAGKYDVPGGRLEEGEQPLHCLLREIREETALHVSVEAPFYVGDFRPVVDGEQWQIVPIYFACEAAASEQVDLGPDHDDYVWIDAASSAEYDLVPGLQEVFVAYQSRNSRS